MNREDQAKWDRIYASNQHGFFPPALVLRMQSHLLPFRGTALDLACGLGRNAVFLCQHGLSTSAWDISGEAIRRLDEYASAEGLAITTEVRDVSTQPPEPDSFDVIVVSHFLERTIMPALGQALTPGGLLFYQTFTRLKVTDTGPENPDYLLEENELLETFAGLELLFYCDNRDVGDTGQGLRNEAMIVVRKKSSQETEVRKQETK
ncbi:MAG: methyltransferase domain-containing protein [Gammaproteobacteria bacterium]|nr:methyltransferase domain-containing protein [Gammaproteobacteria bacterium]